MRERVQKSLSLLLSLALMAFSAGVEPYTALAQVRPISGEPGAPELPSGQVDLSVGEISAAPVAATSELGAATSLSQESLSPAAAQVVGAEKRVLSPVSVARTAQSRVVESQKAEARGTDGSAPLTRLFDSADKASAPSIAVPDSLGLGVQAAPESIPPAAEARLGKISVSYALEAVVEDIPEGREKVVAALADPSYSQDQREAFFNQFSARIQEAGGREGVPADMFPIAKQFLAEVAESGASSNIKEGADALKTALGTPTPIQRASLQEAQNSGLSAADAALAAEVAQRQSSLAVRPGFYKDVEAAASGLRAADIAPTASIVREIVRSAATVGWVDTLTAGKLREYRLSKGVARTAALRDQLSQREPNLFSDREVDVYYSVLSNLIDIKNSGYYGYRKRVDAARAFVREAGLKPGRKPLLPEFELKNAYQPFDASGVDPSVITRNRARISGAHNSVSTLAALSDPRLAGIRDELIRRTWAYVQLWPEAEKDPKSKDEQGRAVPIPSKQIRGYLARSATDIPTSTMEGELKGAGRYLFIGLHATLIFMLAGLPSAKKKEGQTKEAVEQRQAIYDLLATNMLAYQWTDDVARAELNIGDDPSQWQAVEIKLALDRLGYIYYDKSNEFQAFKVGLFVPDEVKAIMSAGRKEAREQHDNIIVNKGTAKDENVRFVQSDGVSGLFRGFCGRDCNKSLAPERGKLAVRSYQPHTSSYLGIVDGKAVGFLTLFEAMKGGQKVLLAELIQFPERESMTPRLLEALDASAKAAGYAGAAVPANLHPWDPVAKETASNFTNFHQTVKAVKNMKAWQEGESFKPKFPWAAEWARYDDILGKVPYYSWGLGDGTYKLLKFDKAAPPTETGSPAAAPEGRLPRSFYTFLAGLSLTAMAQEAIAVMAPLYAAGTEGLGFAVVVQAVGQVFRIPGATIGAKVARKFDSKKVYIFGILLNAAAFFSIPASYFMHVPSEVIKGLFLGFSAVGGLVYGATRGVAENEMPPRIIGQDNDKLLEKAGSLSFAIVEPAAFAAAFGIVVLQSAIGNHAAAVVSGALLALSAIPFAFIKYKQKALHAEAPTGAGSEDKLPIKTYLPYVFFNFIHQSFYSLFAWSVAMEVLHKESLTGSLTGLYDIGSFAIAALLTFLPKLLPKWSEKQWTVAATLPVLGFLWGSLMLGRPLVSLGAAALLGASTTIANVKWKKIYQTRLKLDAQPRVFQWLMISAVLASLLPFLVVSGGTAIGVHVSITTALVIISAGVTAVAAAMLWLIRGKS